VFSHVIAPLNAGSYMQAAAAAAKKKELMLLF
jgi:hypothetical protein